jgi:hypothetical protein
MYLRGYKAFGMVELFCFLIGMIFAAFLRPKLRCNFKDSGASVFLGPLRGEYPRDGSVKTISTIFSGCHL